MRIGYVTYGLNRSPTGIGRYAIELARALKTLPAGPEIVLLTTEDSDPLELWPDFEHHPLPGCQLLPALMTIGNVVLAAAVKRHRLDVVHDPNGIAPFLGPRAGAARVTTIHDAFAYVYPKTHNKLDNWRYRWMLPQATKRADMILTDSLHSQHDIERYLHIPAQKVRAVACAVNPCFMPIADSPNRQDVLARYGITPPYLLYVGAINGRKNIARMFEAYSRIRENHPALTLVVAGKRQWATAEIDDVFQSRNLERYVHFTGYVADSDLPALYSAAEAFIFPSLYEGFGLPPLEAMACGTPVVTSNTSSLPEVVGDAAITVDPYDVDGLAQGIERVLTDTEMRAVLRQRGIAQAAQFTWARTARETNAVYEELAGQKRV